MKLGTVRRIGPAEPRLEGINDIRRPKDKL
jgi:hypothetical protein